MLSTTKNCMCKLILFFGLKSVNIGEMLENRDMHL